MAGMKVYYNVTGRYMDGQKLLAYHLVGDDGSQLRVNKEQVVEMINNNLIYNMRIQKDANGEIIPRGKGINLNKLPVYDPIKNKYRNTDTSRVAANTQVSTSKSSYNDANPMGQFRITKRIMYRTQCFGYEVQDLSGKTYRKKREEIFKLADDRLISNAILRHSKNTETGKEEVILRGVGCDLKKLPMLILDSTGKMVDPSKDSGSLTARIVYMKNNGILHNNADNTHEQFRAGDYLVCMPDGKVKAVTLQSINNKFKVDKNMSSASCDYHIGDIGKYQVEILGKSMVTLTEAVIKKWAVLIPKQTVKV